jgi:phosphotransferase system HPr-like phosphotransfer protein
MEASTHIQAVKKLSYAQLTQLNELAGSFDSYILLESEHVKINLKSILALSILTKYKGNAHIRALGEDAREAVNVVGDFLNRI